MQHFENGDKPEGRQYLHGALLTVIRITDARSPTDDTPAQVEESHDAKVENALNSNLP